MSVLGQASNAGAIEPAPRGKIVDIEVDGSPDAVERVRVSASDVLGRLGLTARVRAEGAAPSAPDTPTLARAYLDLESLSAPRLVVVDSASQRELARRTLSTSLSLETSVEAVVLVLYLVIEARLEELASSKGPTAPVESTESVADASAESGRAGATPSPRARPAVNDESGPTEGDAAAAGESSGVLRPGESRPAADAEDRNGIRKAERWRGPVSFDAGALFRLSTLDGESALTGAGITLSARSQQSRAQWGALFFATAHLPAELSFGDARADLDVVAVRLLPMMGFTLAPALSSVFGVGGGVDWLRVASQSSGRVAVNSVSLADFTVSALAGLRWTVARPLVASLAASFDLDWSPRTFAVDVGDRRRTLLELDRFRPSLLFALALSSSTGAP